MNNDKLEEVLRLHSMWASGETAGIRANLYGANLEGANLEVAILEGANLEVAILEGANLEWANLKGANLKGAILKGANLTKANLYGANFKGAILAEANFNGANLEGANLEVAILERANLIGANLGGANLGGANLGGANLGGANLTRANLERANLEGANLEGARLPNFQLCPEVGQFRAFKKVQSNCGAHVLELLISKRAQRTNTPGSRKCRASRVKVIRAMTLSGIAVHKKEFYSDYDRQFRYVVGEWVESDSYDPDIRNVCTHGIHFFLTFKEAAEY